MLKQSCNELWFVKKYWNRTPIFLCQKLTEFFQKKNHPRISILETIYVKNTFFLTPIFEPLYFLKPCLIFDEPVLHVFSKYNGLGVTHHLQNSTTELILICSCGTPNKAFLGGKRKYFLRLSHLYVWIFDPGE